MQELTTLFDDKQDKIEAFVNINQNSTDTIRTYTQIKNCRTFLCYAIDMNKHQYIGKE